MPRYGVFVTEIPTRTTAPAPAKSYHSPAPAVTTWADLIRSGITWQNLFRRFLGLS